MQRIIYTLFIATFSLFFSAQLTAQCDAGILTTNGEVAVCGAEATFDLNVNGVDPSQGGFGYLIDNSLGGTGGFEIILEDNQYVIVNAPDMATYNSDLNGIVSQNGLPPFDGVWIFKSVMFTDSNDALGTLCDVSEDSLIVNFLTSDAPTVTVVDNGDETATASPMGGLPPYSYLWSDGQTTETAIDVAGQTLDVTVTDANGCTVMGTVDVSVGVGDIKELELLEIAPNPTQGLVVVKMELNTAEAVNLQMYDINGRVIKNMVSGKTTADSFEFDMSNQAAGIYLLRIQIGNNSLVRRIIVGY